jgi:hypothetical protein
MLAISLVEPANLTDRQFSKWKSAIERNAIRQGSVSRRPPVPVFGQPNFMI